MYLNYSNNDLDSIKKSDVKLSIKDQLLSIRTSISREQSKTVAIGIDVTPYKYISINGRIIMVDFINLDNNISVTYMSSYWESGLSYAHSYQFSISVNKEGKVNLYMTSPTSTNENSLKNFGITIYGYK